MSEIKYGGPAFPSTNNVHVGDCVTGGHSGMTLRDYFAAHAMSGLVLRDWSHIQDGSKKIEAWANAAYQVADAMLKARES